MSVLFLALLLAASCGPAKPPAVPAGCTEADFALEATTCRLDECDELRAKREARCHEELDQ